MGQDSEDLQAMSLHLRVMAVGLPTSENMRFEEVLQKLGQDFYSPYDSNDALECFADQAFDIVILNASVDLLPFVLGFCRTIRKSSQGASAHIVVVTEHLHQQDITHLSDVGVDQFLGAPLADAQLHTFLVSSILGHTQRRELQEQLLRHQKLFEESGDFYVLFDIVTGEVIQAHPAIESVLGLKRHSAIGRIVDSLFSDVELIRATRTGEYDERAIEGKAKHQEGREIAVELRMSFVQFMRRTVAQVHCRDISERKATEQKLERYASELRLEKMNLEHQVHLDGLTGLDNRLSFDEHLSREFHAAARTKAPLSLVMIDVDFFKRYNDHFGHQAGDTCLKEIAHVLTSVLKRKTDIAARYGGEEFSLILPATDRTGAMRVAESVRMEVTRLALPHPDSENSGVVSLSLGVATFDSDNFEDEVELVEAADKALYCAKQCGRNRAVAATAE